MMKTVEADPHSITKLNIPAEKKEVFLKELEDHYSQSSTMNQVKQMKKTKVGRPQVMRVCMKIKSLWNAVTVKKIVYQMVSIVENAASYMSEKRFSLIQFVKVFRNLDEKLFIPLSNTTMILNLIQLLMFCIEGLINANCVYLPYTNGLQIAPPEEKILQKKMNGNTSVQKLDLTQSSCLMSMEVLEESEEELEMSDVKMIPPISPVQITQKTTSTQSTIATGTQQFANVLNSLLGSNEFQNSSTMKKVSEYSRPIASSILRKSKGIVTSLKLDVVSGDDMFPQTIQEAQRLGITPPQGKEYQGEYIIDTRIYRAEDIIGVPFDKRYEKAMVTCKAAVPPTNKLYTMQVKWLGALKDYLTNQGAIQKQFPGN